jgi:hypothetical protein
MDEALLVQLAQMASAGVERVQLYLRRSTMRLELSESERGPGAPN